MKELLRRLYHNPLVEKITPTMIACLKQELADCKTVLDLGCGADSPIQFCKNIENSTAVEIYKPYIRESKKKKIHTSYVNERIDHVNFPRKSFDAVIMLEVIEHLPTKVGAQMLKKMQRWAKKKVIISTPNGFVNQGGYDKNSYQRHLSGWSYKKMRRLGFKNYGLAGVKWLREGREHDTEDADLMTSIRFWPKPFWFLIASLSQIFTYYYPRYAFGLFSVKKV